MNRHPNPQHCVASLGQLNDKIQFSVPKENHPLAV